VDAGIRAVSAPRVFVADWYRRPGASGRRYVRDTRRTGALQSGASIAHAGYLPAPSCGLNFLESTPMKRYLIERDIAGVGKLNAGQLKDAAATSNAALASLAGTVQWVQSFVADDKTFCVYLAEDEAAVREHARISGFPASRVTELRGVIDPMTAA
jgi:hypothetical protein